jgi:hypothetical protein
MGDMKSPSSRTSNTAMLRLWLLTLLLIHDLDDLVHVKCDEVIVFNSISMTSGTMQSSSMIVCDRWIGMWGLGWLESR